MKQYPRCHVNYTNKYLFVNISKNASTSLRNAIRFESFLDYNSIDNPDKYLKFIVLRDPIKRSISSFLEIRKLRKDGPYLESMKMKWFREKDVIKSFEIFIDEIEDNFYDSHILPQINFLNDKKLKIQDIDFVLIHERLLDDFEKLIKKYPQIKASKLSNLQVGENKVKQKLTDFTISNYKIREKILKIYSNDYEIYSKYI